MTIKSKAFKFLLGIALVVGLGLVAFSSAQAYDFGTATLRVGSRGADVMEVQKVVGANPVDGIFGPMTMAAVKAWQANNGLVADGVVGNATKATKPLFACHALT
ncbi:MAG TPA: peptidoglycan-binding domain-containing protein, partial [Candidatus Paceibacterota bacterium]|nr:peptidoglycan-binding domain-containing protein [Candidatus Paceibacterota bacterium]